MKQNHRIVAFISFQPSKRPQNWNISKKNLTAAKQCRNKQKKSIGYEMLGVVTEIRQRC